MESILKAVELLHWLNGLFRHHKVKLLLVLIQEFKEGKEAKYLVFVFSLFPRPPTFWPRLAWLLKKILLVPSPVINENRNEHRTVGFFC